jgi:hypothetical protein
MNTNAVLILLVSLIFGAASLLIACCVAGLIRVPVWRGRIHLRRSRPSASLDRQAATDDTAWN